MSEWPNGKATACKADDPKGSVFDSRLRLQTLSLSGVAGAHDCLKSRRTRFDSVGRDQIIAAVAEID